MAMKKAEMEDHKRQYDALIGAALAADKAGLHRMALEKAVACLPHIDGMMRFGRKYTEAQFDSVPAIDLALRYAPLVFDFAALDEVQRLLKECRQIEKNTSDSLADKLAAARTLMWQAHRLWDHLESSPNCRMDDLHGSLGGEEATWRSLAMLWASMGLVRREPEGRTCRLALCTVMSEVVPAKCPACGHVISATKSACLAATCCPACASSVLFVILTTPATLNAKG